MKRHLSPCAGLTVRYSPAYAHVYYDVGEVVRAAAEHCRESGNSESAAMLDQHAEQFTSLVCRTCGLERELSKKKEKK